MLASGHVVNSLQPIEYELHFFDPEQEVERRAGSLPHWMQNGVVCFLTWRTWDSLPTEWAENWVAARADWLRRQRIDIDDPNWKEQLNHLSIPLRAQFHREFSARLEAQLDRCQGECVLRRPEFAEVVSQSFHHFDGQRYALHDFVVMPNHVHLLVTFSSIDEMLSQCASWKRFTATSINRLLGQSGRFWQPEAFDHLVRSEERFRRYREYIALNPVRAGLQRGEYIHYSRPLPE